MNGESDDGHFAALRLDGRSCGRGWVSLLTGRLGDEIRTRFARLLHVKPEVDKRPREARRYVEATLALRVGAHSVYGCIEASARSGHHERD